MTCVGLFRERINPTKNRKTVGVGSLQKFKSADNSGSGWCELVTRLESLPERLRISIRLGWNHVFQFVFVPCPTGVKKLKQRWTGWKSAYPFLEPPYDWPNSVLFVAMTHQDALP